LRPVHPFQQSLFFFGFASIKVAKNTKQNKTNILTNNRKQIGNNSEETKTSALKEKRKEGSRSSPSIEAWQWHPLAPKSNKMEKRVQAPPLLRLGDGAIGTQKQQKKKRRGSASSPYAKTS
jgi:hypothetical protein